MEFDQEIAQRETLLKYAKAAVHKEGSVFHPKKLMDELQNLVADYPLLKCINENDDSLFRYVEVLLKDVIVSLNRYMRVLCLHYVCMFMPIHSLSNMSSVVLQCTAHITIDTFLQIPPWRNGSFDAIV